MLDLGPPPDGPPLRLLDCFGCIGGSATGWRRAGFVVDSVDVRRWPDYPGELIVADAIDYVYAHGREYDAVTGSPPCQGEGALAKGNQKDLVTRHPRLIGPFRAACEAVGRPYVIENVTGAAIRRDLTLCGDYFDLGVINHRHFELGGWALDPVDVPVHPPQVGPYRGHRGYVRGWRHGVYRDGPYVAAYGEGGGKATVDEMRAAKRIDWSRDHLGLREALPPDYTHWLGLRLEAHLRTTRGNLT